MLDSLLLEIKQFFSQPSMVQVSSVPSSALSITATQELPAALLPPASPPHVVQISRRSKRGTSKSSDQGVISSSPPILMPPSPPPQPPPPLTPSWQGDGLQHLLCSLLQSVTANILDDGKKASSVQAASVLQQFLIPLHIAKLPKVTEVVSSDEFFLSYISFIRSLPFLSYAQVNLLKGLLPSSAVSNPSLAKFAHPANSTAVSGLLSSLMARACFALEPEARQQGWSMLLDIIKLSASKVGDQGISNIFIQDDIPALLGILSIAFSSTNGRSTDSRTAFSFTSASSSTSMDPLIRGAQDVAEQICSVGKNSRTSISSIAMNAFSYVAVTRTENSTTEKSIRFFELLSLPQRHWLVRVCIHFLQRRAQHISSHSVTDMLFHERPLQSTRTSLTFLLDAIELEDEECNDCDDSPTLVSMNESLDSSYILLRRPIFQALMTSGIESVLGLEVYIDLIGKSQSEIVIPIHARLLSRLFEILEKLKASSHISLHSKTSTIETITTDLKISRSCESLTTSILHDESGLASKIQPWSLLCKDDNLASNTSSETTSLASSQSSLQSPTSTIKAQHPRTTTVQRDLSEMYSPSLKTIQKMNTKAHSSQLKMNKSVSHDISHSRKKTKLLSKTIDVVELVDESNDLFSENVSSTGRKRGRFRRSDNTSTTSSTPFVRVETLESPVLTEYDLRPRIVLPDAPIIYACHSTTAQGALAFLQVVSDAVVIGSLRIASACVSPYTSSEMVRRMNTSSFTSSSGMSPAAVTAQKRFRDCISQVLTINTSMLNVPDVCIISDEFVAKARNWSNLAQKMSTRTVSLFKGKHLPLESSLFDPSTFFRAGQVISTAVKLFQDYSLLAPSQILVSSQSPCKMSFESPKQKSPNIRKMGFTSLSSSTDKVITDIGVMNIGSSIYTSDDLLLGCTRGTAVEATSQSPSASASPSDIRADLQRHLLLSTVTTSISSVASLSPVVSTVEGASDVSFWRQSSRLQSTLPEGGSAPFIKGPLSRLRLPSPWQSVFPVLEARLTSTALRELQVGAFGGRPRPTLSILMQGASGIWSQDFVRFYLKRRSLESSIDLCFRSLSLLIWPLEIPMESIGFVSVETQKYANLARSSLRALINRWGFDDAVFALSGRSKNNDMNDLPAINSSSIPRAASEPKIESNKRNGEIMLSNDHIMASCEDEKKIKDNHDEFDDDEDNEDEDNDFDDDDNNDDDDDEPIPSRELNLQQSNEGRIPFSTDTLRVDIAHSARLVIEVLGNADIHVLSKDLKLVSSSLPHVVSTSGSHSLVDSEDGVPSLFSIINVLKETVKKALSHPDPSTFVPPPIFSAMINSLIRRLVSTDPSVTLPLHEFFCAADASSAILDVLGIHMLSKEFLEAIAPPLFASSESRAVGPQTSALNLSHSTHRSNEAKDTSGMLALRRLLSILHALIAKSAQMLPLKLQGREHVNLPATPLRSSGIQIGSEHTFQPQVLGLSKNLRRVASKDRLNPENISTSFSASDMSMLRFPISYPKSRSSVAVSRGSLAICMPVGTKALLERPSDESGRKISIDSLELVIHAAGFSQPSSLDSMNSMSLKTLGEKRVRLSSDHDQPHVFGNKRLQLDRSSDNFNESSSSDNKLAATSLTSMREMIGSFDSNFFGSLLLPPTLPFGSIEETVLNKLPSEAISSFLSSSDGFSDWAKSIIGRRIALHPWHVRSLPNKVRTEKSLVIHPHPLVRRLSTSGTTFYCDICGNVAVVRYNCTMCGYDECLPCHRKRFPNLTPLVYRTFDSSTTSMNTPTFQDIDSAVELFRAEGLSGDRLFEAVSSCTGLLDVIDEEIEDSQKVSGFEDAEQDAFGDLLDREYAASGGGGGGGSEYLTRSTKMRTNSGNRQGSALGETSSRPKSRLIGGAPVPFHALISGFDSETCAHRITYSANGHQETILLPLCHYALLPSDLPDESIVASIFSSFGDFQMQTNDSAVVAQIEESHVSSQEEVIRDVDLNVEEIHEDQTTEAMGFEDDDIPTLSQTEQSTSVQAASIPMSSTSVGAVPTPRNVSKDWSCEACTFINPFATGVCSMCGTGQPASIRMLKVEQGGIVPKPPPVSDPNEVTWDCPHCTVRTVIVKRFPGGPRSVFSESLLKLAVIDICTMCQSPVPREVIDDAINKQRIAAGLPPGGPLVDLLKQPSSAAPITASSSSASLTPSARFRHQHVKTTLSLLSHLESLVLQNEGSKIRVVSSHFVETLYELPPHLIKNSGSEVTSERSISVEIGSFNVKLGDKIDAVGVSGRWLEAIVIAFGRHSEKSSEDTGSSLSSSTLLSSSTSSLSSSLSSSEEKISHVLVRYISWDSEYDRWLPIDFVSLPGRSPIRLVAASGTNTRDWRYEIITRREDHHVELFSKGRWHVARVLTVDGVDFSLGRPALVKLFPRIHVTLSYQNTISGVTGEKSLRVKLLDENLAPIGTHLPWPLGTSKTSHSNNFSFTSWKNLQDKIKDQVSKCGVGPALVFCSDVGSLKSFSFLSLRNRSSFTDVAHVEPFRRISILADDESARAVLSLLTSNKNLSKDFAESKRFLLLLKNGASHHGCTARDFAACVSRSAIQCFYDCLSHSTLFMELERKYPRVFPKGQSSRIQKSQPTFPLFDSCHVSWSSAPLRMATNWDEGRASFAFDRSAERPPKPREIKAGQLFERALGYSMNKKEASTAVSIDERVFHIRLCLRIFGCDDSSAWEMVPSDKPILTALQEASCKLLVRSGVGVTHSNEVAKELAGAFMQESVAGTRKKILPLRVLSGSAVPVSSEIAFLSGLHVQVHPVLLQESSKLNTIVSPLVEARNAARDITFQEKSVNLPKFSTSSFETLVSSQTIDAIQLLGKLRDAIIAQDSSINSRNTQELLNFGKMLLTLMPSNSLLTPQSAVENLFINDAISLMCEIQIADTLACSSFLIPKWVTEVVNKFQYLLPASLRKALLTQVAFGPINVATQIQDQVVLVQELLRAGKAGAREIRYDDFGRPQQLEVVVKVLPGLDHIQAYRLVSLRGQDLELAAEARYGREQSPRGSQMTHSPLGIIYRDRVEISRQNILTEASQMLLLHSKGSGSRSVLNVNFAGEKGSGEGPTRDFFSSIADELQRRSSQDETQKDVDKKIISCNNSLASQEKLFYHSGSESASHVQHSSGLFPTPLDLTQCCESILQEVSQNFCLIGRCVGKAIKDSHIFPLPLSVNMFAVIQRITFSGRVLPLTSSTGINLLHEIMNDPLFTDVFLQYIPTMSEVLKIGKQRLRMRQLNIQESDEILVQLNKTISSYMLEFRHPGTDADLSLVPLIHCGVPGSLDHTEAILLEKRILSTTGLNDEITSSTNVTGANVDVYVSKLIAFTVWYGIRLQCSSFVNGLRDIIPNVSLFGCLTPSEIRDLACGSPSVDWTRSDLSSHIKLQPGQYSMNSQPAQFFFSSLLDMDQLERQEFLRFVTGCPFLPVGGLAALYPPLTLMQKGSTSAIPLSEQSKKEISQNDNVLVSSSTCFHQIKLPPYSSLEVTKRMLRNSVIMSRGLIDMS